MRFGYARVSTKDQSLDLQTDALRKAGVEQDAIYYEKASGMKDDRATLNEMLAHLRKGDTLVVYKLDRISRSTKHLIALTDDLRERGIDFVSIADNIDTTTAMGRFFFRTMASIAELERDIISERTQAGLAAARSRGRHGGRPSKPKAIVDRAIKLYESNDYSVPEIEDLTGVSKATLYRAIKRNKQTN